MTTWIQTVWDWRLPKRYYLSMCLKGLQSWKKKLNFFHLSKITFFFLYIILSYENSATYEHFWFFQVLKLWQPVTLQPLEAQGHVLHIWKPPINICLEPDCQGGCSVLKVCLVMLKSWGLLNKLLYASDLLCTPLYIHLWKVPSISNFTDIVAY